MTIACPSCGTDVTLTDDNRYGGDAPCPGCGHLWEVEYDDWWSEGDDDEWQSWSLVEPGT